MFRSCLLLRILKLILLRAMRLRTSIFWVILFFILLITRGATADWIDITSKTPHPYTIDLIETNHNTSLIKFNMSGFYLETTDIDGMILHNISQNNNGTPILLKGAPELIKYSTSLILPDLYDTRIKVKSSNYRDYHNIQIDQSEGNVSSNGDLIDNVDYGWTYDQDKFFPESVYESTDPFILRDYRGQTIFIYPFQYNPVSKILRFYYEIEIEIIEDEENSTNPFYRQKDQVSTNPVFIDIYSSQFINGSTKDCTISQEQDKMLIISYGEFINAMSPLLDWKISKGINTEIVDVARFGNEHDIKSYVTNYYYSQGLTYLLLVGDAEQVPSHQTCNGTSDNTYSYIVGDDQYPDIIVGRFSANNIDQVRTQVDRTIKYEKNPSAKADGYNRILGLGSDKGPGDDNELDYEHIRKLQIQMLNNPYSTAFELFDGSRSGNDEPGDPTASQVIEKVNIGVGVILYCGLGTQNSWSTSHLKRQDLDNLENCDHFPFIISASCYSGDFDGKDCLAEAWLQASALSRPTGAIAASMATD